MSGVMLWHRHRPEELDFRVREKRLRMRQRVSPRSWRKKRSVWGLPRSASAYRVSDPAGTLRCDRLPTTALASAPSAISPRSRITGRAAPKYGEYNYKPKNHEARITNQGMNKI